MIEAADTVVAWLVSFAERISAQLAQKLREGWPGRRAQRRGTLQDDNAHNWNASYPSANFDDGLVAGVRKGDVLTRKLGGAIYEIVRVVPNGFGRTTLQLSKRKRTLN
jgi:hypothetical protein